MRPKPSNLLGRIGFTLTELMIVIVITGIAVTASMPAFGRFMQSWRLSGEAENMATMLRKARSVAVMKNIDAVFDFDDTNNNYFYFEDDNGNGTKDAGEYQSETRTFAPGIEFDSKTLSGTSVTFGPKGNTLESGTITLANVRSGNRTIRIFGGTGNIQVD